jgi:hypothetical protein
MRIETIDLNFLGAEEVIASYLLLGADSAALVETGPTTCLDSLTAGLKDHGVSGDYSNLVDGLMRYVAKRRDRAPE